MIRLSSLASIVVLSACAGSGDASDAAPALELEEAFAYTLPDSLRPTGIAVRDSAEVLVWSLDRVVVVNPTDSAARATVRRVRAAPLAAVINDGATLGVMDATGEWRYDLRRADAPVKAGSPGEPLQILNAVRTPRGWVVGGTDGQGRFHLVSRRPSGPSDVLWTISPDTLREGRLPGYLLSPSTAGVLISEAESPYRTWRVDWDGSVHVPFAPRRSALPPGRQGRDARWISLPVVDLRTGYLQTLSDLGSDRRVLVTYDDRGRQVRVSVLGVPLGIAGMSEDGRFLVGARDVGRPEVVLYRWRWTTSELQPGADP